MRVKLTPAFVDAIKPHPAKRLSYFDEQELGLELRITPKGARSWCLRYRDVAGEQWRVTIGRYPVISVARARHLARQVKSRATESKVAARLATI